VFPFCCGKCSDKHAQNEMAEKTARAEAARLMEQYKRGGWKPN
jgi:hypothetical protein